MWTSLNLAGKTAARSIMVGLVVSTTLLAGCASGVVANTSGATALVAARPDTVYVYAFESSPDQVNLDQGLVQRMKAGFSGTSAQTQQAQQANAAREQVANEIVRKLTSMGMHAVRSDLPATAEQNVLMIQGNFATIDEGNRRRRMLIGLGAGKSVIEAEVQLLYKPAGGLPVLVQSFDAKADSGKMPGVAETAGVGAVAGHVATSAALGAGMHAGAETKQDGISGDAKRLGDAVAKQVAQIGVASGWISPEHSN